MNVRDFVKISEMSTEQLHKLWFAYLKENSIEGFIDEIRPFCIKNEDWAIRLFRFSYTWVTGNMELKGKWYDLLTEMKLNR